MTELKVKCESCGHLQRLFDYDKHTFDIPANQNEAFNKWLEEHDKQIKAEVIDEVMKRAEAIQLEQIENLNKSTRRNGKMWAKYMSTYLGHIQVACKRMLEQKGKE